MLVLSLIILAYLFTAAAVFTYKAITEKDLVKAIIYSASQSVIYAIAYATLLAPDILLAYVAVGIGIYSIIMLYVVSKTERFEGEGA